MTTITCLLFGSTKVKRPDFRVLYEFNYAIQGILPFSRHECVTLSVSSTQVFHFVVWLPFVAGNFNPICMFLENSLFFCPNTQLTATTYCCPFRRVIPSSSASFFYWTDATPFTKSNIFQTLKGEHYNTFCLLLCTSHTVSCTFSLGLVSSTFTLSIY